VAIKSYILAFLFSLLFFFNIEANNTETIPATSEATVAAHPIEEKEDVSAEVVEHIMNHVADANENHIATIKKEGQEDQHISMPLPCILYSKSTGKLSIFMSSKLSHSHEGYEGYKMDHHTNRVVDAVTGTRDTFYDFSITKNVFNMLLGFLILTIIFFVIKNAYIKNAGKAPKGIQSFFEPIIQFLTDEVAKPNLGNQYEKFLPYLICVFFFILINNLLGLIPFIGGINSSGNISFTLVLAMCSLLLINLNGNKHYWQHIFAMPGVPKWVLVILTPIELLGVFLKPAVLMLRLFGNITGGHIAVLAIVSLIFIMGKMGTTVGGATAGGVIAIPILLFVNAMELFVAFLQAYVFTLLSAIFIGAAIEDHHHAEEHH
jgi:F-type H+-transporting ATPase subunit a